MKQNLKEVLPAPTYPRTYRADRTIKIVFSVLGMLFLILATVRVTLDLSSPKEHPKIISELFFFGLGVCMGFFFFYLVSTEVTLFEDAIEKKTCFSCSRMSREEILGWRGESSKRYGGYTYILAPRDPQAKRMRLPPIFRWDKTFFEWKKSIPHLKN